MQFEMLLRSSQNSLPKNDQNIINRKELSRCRQENQENIQLRRTDSDSGKLKNDLIPAQTELCLQLEFLNMFGAEMKYTLE